MLRDFWFPVLLTLASVAPGIAGMYAEGNARRLWWTVTTCLWFLAVMSYIWGDPVRGPFAKLANPRAGDTFTIHAGGSFILPISDLRKGVNFSRAISMPGNPIDLFVKRTWWSGWKCNLTANVDGRAIKLMENNEVGGDLPPGYDLNFDDSAIELITPSGVPGLQIIQDGDYDIWVNAIIQNRQQGAAMVIKGNSLRMKPAN